MTKTKVIIAGGRDFNDFTFFSQKVKEALVDLNLDREKTLIIEGGARGADRMAYRFAKKHNITTKRENAEWNKYGNAAGPIRNKKMAEQGDVLIAFWDGQSSGTKNMIEEAEKKGLKLYVNYYTSKNS